MAHIGWLHKFSSNENIDKFLLLSQCRYLDALGFDILDKYKICLGYNNTKYIVTDKGDIYHYIPQYELIKKLEPFTLKGYKRIQVRMETGERVQLQIHRIVASLFIPNPENKPEVNHKNRNKADNCVENLEWVTKSENELHKWKTQGGMKESTKKKISEAHKGGKAFNARKVECIETGETWDTAKNASLALGYSKNRVGQVCKTGSAIKGFHYRFIQN